MDLKYLKTFKTIIETGSFLSAAHTLNYTQSTVTFQIQQLEQELTCKLFEKIGRKMVVTQTGKELLPYIDSIFQSVEQLENHGKAAHKLTGTLKVAIPETLLIYKMQPILKKFRQQAPNVQLSLQSLNCYTIRDQLLHGDVDLVIHYDVGGYPATITTEKLASFPLVLIVSPDLAEEHCDFISENQRKNLCLITNDYHSIFHEIFAKYLKERNIVLAGSMDLGSIEAIKRSVISNLGMSCLPRYVVQEELAAGTLKELPLAAPNNVITAICAYHKNKWLSPSMKLFIQLLQENLCSK